MNILLTIDPDKEDQITQLLEALQELGVIEEFSPFSGEKPAAHFQAESVYVKQESIAAFDLAEQYRDLVD